ncbi:DNA-binding protein [Hydrogenophaga crocea]|uniref:DNA-binding protein n=1 Tax=Hydrogenophaga crocea TaxID=2716225 RepID=A0A6G8INZ3_9BURK|nr:DNA-binding protein [Hydrogenophaga crocea]
MTRTADAVRSEFAERGITIRDWARSEGFSDKLVYYVLTGKRIPRRGTSYRIALALGMRAPQPSASITTK